MEIERTLPPGAAGAPGWVAAIFDREGIRRAWVTGRADLRAERPLGLGSRLRWYSVTKLATATAAMRLVDEGALDPDAPVAERLPWVAPTGPRGARPITARHLLSHTAGLADPSALRWVHPPGGARRSPAELTRETFARHRRLRALPGTVGRYTNLGYLVLGELIAAAAGGLYARVLTDRVLAPAGLAGARFDPAGAAVGHEALRSARAAAMAALFFPRTFGLVRYVRRGWVGLSAFELEGQAYGGLVGSLEDLVGLGCLHLRDGEGVLAGRTARAMREVHGAGPEGRFGLGFWILGDGWVGHGGEAGGYRAELALHPGRGVGVAVLANGGAARTDRVLEALRRRATGGPMGPGE
ncbi:MAG TPA: serine hydrolase domain-containing protein [Sandaracinaceae bacterium LLY-WYZ-13_1]|nr:serine hydrolase domain-containing protein [Sandaracinaceae bacterium LLY-WYZ-13_1]